MADTSQWWGEKLHRKLPLHHDDIANPISCYEEILMIMLYLHDMNQSQYKIITWFSTKCI